MLFTAFAMVILITVGFVKGVLCERHALKERREERRERRDECARLVDTGAQTEPAATRSEEKGSQSPCTYTRHRAQPRFVPLPSRSWG